MTKELNIKFMTMTIPLVILIVVLVYFIMKNSHLKQENRILKKKKNDAETTASIYFNQVIQYRDIIIRNNLEIPDANQIITNNTNSDKSFTVDGILDEIAEKGIDNISKDKLDFLRNKQDGKD